MKIHNIEATDMGNDQQEIADRALEIVGDTEFKTEKEFWAIESDLIEKSCSDLNWASVPTTGGLLPNWDSEDGEFHSN